MPHDDVGIGFLQLMFLCLIPICQVLFPFNFIQRRFHSSRTLPLPPQHPHFGERVESYRPVPLQATHITNFFPCRAR